MQRSRRTPGPQNRYAGDLTKRVGAATGASPGSTGHAITAEHKRFSLHQELSTGLSARTVLVTGASRGFGRALAVELLGRGAAVYAG
ncbi:MAG TPA: hypothetical protein VK584_06765, partial [Streptosporangiaceae bacterium]|nr:hypothetical protein [Streptosporangiaceae bacterium]